MRHPMTVVYLTTALLILLALTTWAWYQKIMLESTGCEAVFSVTFIVALIATFIIMRPSK